MSIPRDTWVDIPDRRANRIATAYSAGGPSLLIRTVEGLTDLRIDHFAVIDFAGFRSMVDAVGGIDVDVPAPVGAFGRGVNHMDGAQALAYVRDPSGLPEGRSGPAPADRAPGDADEGRVERHADRPRPAVRLPRRREPIGGRGRHPEQRRNARAGAQAQRARSGRRSSSSARRWPRSGSRVACPRSASTAPARRRCGRRFATAPSPTSSPATPRTLSDP